MEDRTRHDDEQSANITKSEKGFGMEQKKMNLDALLNGLRVAARSNYAVVAYIGLLAAWVYVAISRSRLDATTKSLKVLRAEQRAEALRRLYPEFPTTGMSADEFIRSRRNGHFLIAFIAFLVAVVAIAALAIGHILKT